jgi:hypothetical protein
MVFTFKVHAITTNLKINSMTNGAYKQVDHEQNQFYITTKLSNLCLQNTRYFKPKLLSIACNLKKYLKNFKRIFYCLKTGRTYRLTLGYTKWDICIVVSRMH